MICCRIRRLWMSLIGILPVITLSVAMYRFGYAETESFNPRVVLRRSLPSIKNAPFFNADKADLHESELIVGIVIDGQARAYPINMLTGPSREIINDRLAGQAIAATW